MDPASLAVLLGTIGAVSGYGVYVDRKGPSLSLPHLPAPEPEKKPEPPKVEPPKVEPPKVEPPKVQPPKVEPPKTPDRIATLGTLQDKFMDALAKHKLAKLELETADKKIKKAQKPEEKFQIAKEVLEANQAQEQTKQTAKKAALDAAQYALLLLKTSTADKPKIKEVLDTIQPEVKTLDEPTPPSSITEARTIIQRAVRKTTPKITGYCPLTNKGMNQCYMNSAIQMLYSIPPLQEALEKMSGASKREDCFDPELRMNTLKALKLLFDEMKKLPEKPLDIQSLKIGEKNVYTQLLESVKGEQRPAFQAKTQQDPFELVTTGILTAFDCFNFEQGLKLGHQSECICMATLTVPTLLDFLITCDRLSIPCGCASLMVEPPIVMRPGAVWMGVLALTKPLSMANAATNGFIVEPGSKLSVRARLRNCSPVRLMRRLGLKLG
jgi:hypothetical protein